MKIIDHGPADILHRTANRHQHRHICSRHLNQLSKADHKTCCRHDRNDRHQHLAKLLKKIKVKIQMRLFVRFPISAHRCFFCVVCGRLCDL